MRNPTLIDIHAHVNFAAFREDGDVVLQRAREKNIWVINVGTQTDTSRRAIESAEKFDRGVYAIVGLHPIHLEAQEVDEEETHFKTRGEEFDYKAYKMMAQNEKVVGIGECGLDYYRLPELTPNTPNSKPNDRPNDVDEIKQRQEEALIQQIELANELNKPVMFHTRASKEDPEGAYFDLIEIIKQHPPAAGGDIHCFSGTKEIAQKFLDLGLYLSFTGIVTFKNAESLREVVRYVPLERMMVETDAPYLAPDPFRGKRCEPAHVEYTARKIAEVKGISFEEVAERTTENAKILFRL
ncbi:hypothetical protein A3B36_02140 [Candidatus Uhrbacteria bacterium RIFCSPLOWO2_01_FULL_55_36]|uniref:Hydrolase TatD n=1 Tax=Candidatus Uhrbacteria bacterium RIFCSPLOWO2_01_FULL_55_36 TaxID=1802404 RepID=A0A1F7V075_9BACT|nr:MAG: hypothetical protein A3B36_02140 [Candidatus Uhrbacteria bacterium RIFCSPLOWO2_01_FULL_55_36]